MPGDACTRKWESGAHGHKQLLQAFWYTSQAASLWGSTCDTISVQGIAGETPLRRVCCSTTVLSDGGNTGSAAMVRELDHTPSHTDETVEGNDIICGCGCILGGCGCLHQQVSKNTTRFGVSILWNCSICPSDTIECTIGCSELIWRFKDGVVRFDMLLRSNGLEQGNVVHCIRLFCQFLLSKRPTSVDFTGEITDLGISCCPSEVGVSFCPSWGTTRVRGGGETLPFAVLDCPTISSEFIPIWNGLGSLCSLDSEGNDRTSMWGVASRWGVAILVHSKELNGSNEGGAISLPLCLTDASPGGSSLHRLVDKQRSRDPLGRRVNDLIGPLNNQHKGDIADWPLHAPTHTYTHIHIAGTYRYVCWCT